MTSIAPAACRHFVRGDRIYLRDVLLSDVNAAYCGWMNDPEVTQYLESRFTSATPESLRAYVTARAQDDDTAFLAIVTCDGDRHIGNIKLGPIDRNHGVADIGIIIGEKECWGRGYATEAITLVVRYAFETLGVRRLTAGAYAGNEGSIRAFEKAGFAREGVRRQHYRSGNGYVDGIQMGLLRDEA